MQIRTAFLAALALAAFASLPAEAGPKKYFLTIVPSAGNEALDACGKGYHMAALWEILDVTQLKYDATRGIVPQDAAAGPPSGLLGWVRTSGAPATNNIPGVGNCSAWTSNSPSHYGTVVDLDPGWAAPAIVSSPWGAGSQPCHLNFYVWCKQN